MTTVAAAPPATSAVPFAPVIGHLTEVRYSPEDQYGYNTTPLMDMARTAFRWAAVTLALGGDLDAARQRAETGMALEDAYLARARAEVHGA